MYKALNGEGFFSFSEVQLHCNARILFMKDVMHVLDVFDRNMAREVELHHPGVKFIINPFSKHKPGKSRYYEATQLIVEYTDDERGAGWEVTQVVRCRYKVGDWSVSMINPDGASYNGIIEYHRDLEFPDLG
jgi:hypothetical protein